MLITQKGIFSLFLSVCYVGLATLHSQVVVVVVVDAFVMTAPTIHHHHHHHQPIRDTTRANHLLVATTRPQTTATTTTPPGRGATNLFGFKQDKNDKGGESSSPPPPPPLPPLLSSSCWLEQTQKQFQSITLALTLATAIMSLPAFPAAAATTTTTTTTTTPQDSTAIVKCLFQKCSLALGKCIANPACLANVICINSCTGKPDEINCQIACGNLFENDVVGEFNKCAISDMACVPKQPDDGSYPVPDANVVVPNFDTKLFNGKWYITAGQNPLFDIFPCQVHFFKETEPGSFFGKLNWRIEEPDGEFFTRDALQEFVQDKKQPGHLINDNNEYLHYSDQWWILDYEYDDNKDGVPPFAFVYYRGSNDAWDGYGGAVVYTRAASLPESLLPRLRQAAAKVNFDFDKDFTITDNSCPSELSEDEKLILREQFAGKVALQTEQQLQAAATRFRGTAANSIKAQKIFFENRSAQAQQAFTELAEKVEQFEKEATKQ